MKFCFYGSGIYEALTNRPSGGAEMQLALIARMLSDKGHRVAIIDNHKSGKNIIFNNIEIYFTAHSNLRGIRFLFEKIPNSFIYLFKIKADYYYLRGFSYKYFIVAFISKIRNAKLIIGISSDMDVLGFKKRIKYLYHAKRSFIDWIRNDIPSSIIASTLLKLASIRIVQHEDQKKALQSFKIESTVVPNFSPTIYNEKNTIIEDSYIYVGSLIERKGLSDLVKLIELCPEINFKIIGSPQGKIAGQITRELIKLSNVEFFNQLPREQVILKIVHSKGLLNFSKMEGFPNTFLEAWSGGIPVFSLWVDPGNVIKTYNLGKCFNGNIPEMADYLNSSNHYFNKQQIMNYISDFHSFDHICNLFMDAVVTSKTVK